MGLLSSLFWYVRSSDKSDREIALWQSGKYDIAKCTRQIAFYWIIFTFFPPEASFHARSLLPKSSKFTFSSSTIHEISSHELERVLRPPYLIIDNKVKKYFSQVKKFLWNFQPIKNCENGIHVVKKLWNFFHVCIERSNNFNPTIDESEFSAE